MAKAPGNFKQGDVTKAAKGVRAAGLEVIRTEIDRDGRIILIHRPEDGASSTTAKSVFDRYEAEL